MTWLAASRSVLKPGESARESPTTPNEAITAPTRTGLKKAYRLKNGDPATWGWSPRLRFWLGYFTPDESYEALIAKLVREGTAWIEPSCGRHVLPYDQSLTRMLADRCAILGGGDSSDNLEENQLVHQREKNTVEDSRSERAFDLATLQWSPSTSPISSQRFDRSLAWSNPADS